MAPTRADWPVSPLFRVSGPPVALTCRIPPRAQYGELDGASTPKSSRHRRLPARAEEPPADKRQAAPLGGKIDRSDLAGCRLG